MNDQDKSKEQLVNELTNLRCKVSELEESEARLKGTERLLRESEERYRSLVENIDLGISSIDSDHNIIMSNTTIGKWYDKPASELGGKKCYQMFRGRQSVCQDCHGVQAMTTGKAAESESDGLRGDGTRRNVRVQCFPTVGPDGVATGFVEVVEDITERRQAEDKLRESERKYRDLFEGAPVGIFQSTIDGRVLSVNQTYAHMYGYASAEQAAKEIDNVAERIYVEPGRRKKLIDLALIADGFVRAENQYRKKDGSLFWGQLYFRVVRDRDGEVKHLEGFVEDITERKRAEEQIKKSLEEKEVLLREINHRVKNNLQVISSLVRLQTRQVTAENCSHALHETQNRLQTIGLIHEMLHQSRNLAYIDVEGYLKRLIANLFSLYGAKSGRIETTIDAQELRLGVDKADPLGLIANELVSNCLKYAFPGGRKGIIRISLAVESNELELTVSDNGVGLREDFDPFNAQTLGLVLVNTLVKQLNGVISVKRTAGTKFLIRFPVSTS